MASIESSEVAHTPTLEEWEDIGRPIEPAELREGLTYSGALARDSDRLTPGEKARIIARLAGAFMAAIGQKQAEN